MGFSWSRYFYVCVAIITFKDYFDVLVCMKVWTEKKKKKSCKQVKATKKVYPNFFTEYLLVIDESAVS